MNTNEAMNKVLIELSKQQVAQAWIGANPPDGIDSFDIAKFENFRLPQKFHQKYKIVWLYEFMLNKFHPWSWRIALDESIRLIGKEGRLVVRTMENSEITIPMIKAFLGRVFDIDCSIYCEHRYENAIWIFVLDVKRLNIEKYSSQKWTFGILTNGQKVENVVNFLESVRKSDDKHQIIISGPKNNLYDKYNVEYLDLSPFRDKEYAEISQKKNAIAAMAKNENLMLLHDRFVLSSDFFDGFEKYGYDFSFVAIKQFYKDGTIYPFYCAAPCAEYLHWKDSIQVDNYNLLYPAAYLNGGLLIFKTHILRQLKFNNLLMWNQQEDCEVSKLFCEHSIVPRVNLFSSAVTVAGKEKSENFIVEKLDEPCYSYWGYDSTKFPDSQKEDAEAICYTSTQRLVKKFAKFVPASVKENAVYKSIREKILSRKS